MTRATLADRLFDTLLRERGVEEHPSQFSSAPALWVEGREFLHTHGRSIEARLTRRVVSAQRERLRAHPAVTLGRSDWVSVRLARASDLALAVELGRFAAEANRRGPGERARAPVDDRSIARRRRTHRLATDDLTS